MDTSRRFTLGAVSVAGPDAYDFLNAQLSTDVPTQGGAAQLTAWHSPKGRVKAVIIIVNRGSGWSLLTHVELHEMLARELSRYVLRADVSVAPAAVQSLTLADEDDGDALRVGQFRFAFEPGSLEPAGLTNSAALALIESGIAMVGPEGADSHLPQSLNLDCLGAVAFDKGCYPGQEIIARTQNLGRIKRRLVALRCRGGLPAAGSAIVNEDGEKRGEVVLAAACGDEDAKLLATVELRAIGSEISLQDNNTRLTHAPLPYTVPELEGAN